MAVVTSDYHVQRARILYEYPETPKWLDEKIELTIKKCKEKGLNVKFISAESILPHRDKKFVEIIKRMKKKSAYKKRLANEARGVKMITSNRYGMQKSKRGDKLERKNK